MKSILTFLLFTTPLVTNQAVIFNTPTKYIYVVDFNQSPIEILSIHENTYLPIACLDSQSKQLKDVNFSNLNSCLVDSLNQTFDLNINHTVDMKHAFKTEEIKAIAKEKRMSQIFSLIQKTSISYSYFELYEMYRKAKENEFKYQFLYPTAIIVDSLYIPLSIN